MEDDFASQNYDGAVTTCARNVANTIADIYGVSLSGSTTSNVAGGNYNYTDNYHEAPVAKPAFWETAVDGLFTILAYGIVIIALFFMFVVPFGHSAGWYWGPFGWFGWRHRRGPRRPPYDDFRPRSGWFLWSPWPAWPQRPPASARRWIRRPWNGRRKFWRHGRWTLGRQLPFRWRRLVPLRWWQLPRRRRWTRALNKHEKNSCTSVQEFFHASEITWCRKYGHQRRPGRGRCSRSRSGGRPWRPGRYPHRGEPCAGPRCLPERRSGR